MSRVPNSLGGVERQDDRRRPALSDRLALRPAEVAEALGLSERTIRQILPELPHVRIGSAVLVPTDMLKEWLRERAQQEKGAVDQAVEDVLDGLGRSS